MDQWRNAFLISSEANTHVYHLPFPFARRLQVSSILLLLARLSLAKSLLSPWIWPAAEISLPTSRLVSKALLSGNPRVFAFYKETSFQSHDLRASYVPACIHAARRMCTSSSALEYTKVRVPALFARKMSICQANDPLAQYARTWLSTFASQTSSVYFSIASRDTRTNLRTLPDLMSRVQSDQFGNRGLRRLFSFRSNGNLNRSKYVVEFMIKIVATRISLAFNPYLAPRHRFIT